MKKIVLALFILLSLNSFSQISINSSHMPSAGDTLRFSTAIIDSTILANYQASGANVTWNFDSLRPIRQGVQRFVSSSQTPYANDVPSRIGLLYADTLSYGNFSIYDAYNFLNDTTTDFSIDFRGATAPTGLSFPFPATIKLVGSYTDKDEIFQFPLNYQDRDSSTFNFVYDNQLFGVYYASSGYRINNVDAWGTLSTPYGTFSCIRVVTDMVSYDTVSFSGQNFGINSHIREYQWVSDQIKIPALKVNGNVVGGVFIPTTVEYRDSARVIEPIFPTVAIFATQSTNVEVDSAINITNLSINSDSFQWSFFPNTVTYLNGSSSTSRNVTVSFQDTGSYSVQLIASGARSSDTLRINNYINVNEIKPTAVFEADTTIVRKNKSVNFVNSSLKSNSFQWDFTPNTVTYLNGTSSTSKNITVSFPDTGLYDVRLIASAKIQSDTSYKANYIRVVDLPEADFEAESDTAITGIFHTIYNRTVSNKPATYLWGINPKTFKFRTGSDFTSNDSIVVQFMDTGYYNIQLIATNSDGSDTLTRNNFIYVVTQVGLGEINKEVSNKLKLQPNPVNGEGTVQLTTEENLTVRVIEIFDGSGKLIDRINITNPVNTMQVKAPEIPGVYFIKVETNKGVAMKKLLVN